MATHVRAVSATVPDDSHKDTSQAFTKDSGERMLELRKKKTSTQAPTR